MTGGRRLPPGALGWVTRYSTDVRLTSEDLPRPANRVFYRDDRVHLDPTPGTMPAHHLLRETLRRICGRTDIHPRLFDRALYLGKDTPIGGTAHQSGTLVFGEDPDSAVLDLDCRAHGIDNLCVTDASFFPSIGAVNPTLTIIANALRVAGIIGRRWS